MTEETCSWEQLVEKNRVLQETIDKLKLAQAVAAQLPGNPHLKMVSARTQTYQTPGSEVEVDTELAEWMFWKGAEWEGGINQSGKHNIDAEIVAAIAQYKAQQADSPAIDNDST